MRGGEFWIYSEGRRDRVKEKCGEFTEGWEGCREGSREGS